jgi:hypothetical protein
MGGGKTRTDSGEAPDDNALASRITSLKGNLKTGARKGVRADHASALRKKYSTTKKQYDATANLARAAASASTGIRQEDADQGKNFENMNAPILDA